MKMKVIGQLPTSARDIMRRMGYGEVVDRKFNTISYARRLGSGRYPRFHVYVEKIPDGVSVNIHIDQKKASYKGSAAHSGEYEGPQLEEELRRIQAEISRL
jgi:hypothetical protein